MHTQQSQRAPKRGARRTTNVAQVHVHEDLNEGSREIQQNHGGAKYTIPALPIYEGDPRKLLVKVWRFSVNQHFEFAEEYNRTTIGPRHQVIMAGEQFVGRAKVWWTARIIQGDIPADLDELETAMKSYFELDSHRSKSLRRQYRAARQIGGVSQYNDHFLDVFVQLEDLSETQAVFDYIHGLNPELAARVDETQPVTLKEAMAMALDKERFCTPRRQSYGAPNNPQMGRSVPPRMNAGESQREGKRKFDDVTKRGDTPRTPLDQITCFLCTQKGHYARDCPSGDPSVRQQAARQPRRWDRQRETFLKQLTTDAKEPTELGN